MGFSWLFRGQKSTPHEQAVVIWHVGRCGSTVLGLSLNQHSQIAWLNEIFNPWMPARRGAKPDPDLDQILAASKQASSKLWRVLEIKLLDCQHPGLFGMDAAELLGELIRRGYRHHVILERSNSLKRMVSHCKAAQTGIYHIKRDAISGSDDAPLFQAFKMPINDILVGTARAPLQYWLDAMPLAYQALTAALVSSGVSWIRLSYEEDLDNSSLNGYTKICEWLNLPRESVSVALAPTNSLPLRQLLSNYDEIASLLEGTSHAWMLD